MSMERLGKRLLSPISFCGVVFGDVEEKGSCPPMIALLVDEVLLPCYVQIWGPRSICTRVQFFVSMGCSEHKKDPEQKRANQLWKTESVMELHHGCIQ
jgi:hypothetical protein